MAAHMENPGSGSDKEEPEPGEEKVFWDNERVKRRFLSRRGRRRAPTEEVVPEDSHWERVQGAPVEGASVYEWRPPEEETELAGVEAGIQPKKQEGVAPETPPETETAPPEVPVVQEPGEGREGPTPGEHGPEEEPEMPVTQPPTTAHVSLVAETEHAMLFQEDGHYTVENTETGSTLSLPGSEWEELSSYLKRGSRMA